MTAFPHPPTAQTEAPFSGVGVALLTLFNDDGSIDAAATADLASQLVDAGVSAVVVAGSTGEAAALSGDERTILLDAVVAAVRPTGAKVVAGTGAVTAAQACTFTNEAIDHGAEVVLVLSPPWASDPRPYYSKVTKAAGDAPVLAYHYPAASAPGIAVDMLADLPVAGCKDSSGDCDRLLETLIVWDKPLYVGSSSIVSYAGQLGLPGVILALANAEPELCLQAFAGDGDAQRKLAAAHTTMQRNGFPSGIKQLAAARWGTSTTRRLG